MRLVIILILSLGPLFSIGQELSGTYSDKMGHLGGGSGTYNSSFIFMPNYEFAFVRHELFEDSLKGTYKIIGDTIVFSPYELNKDSILNHLYFEITCIDDDEFPKDSVRLLISNLTSIDLEQVVVEYNHYLPSDTISKLKSTFVRDFIELNHYLENSFLNYIINVGYKKVKCKCLDSNTLIIIIQSLPCRLWYPTKMYFKESRDRITFGFSDDPYSYYNDFVKN